MEVRGKGEYNYFMSQIAHPFVKWAGGKTQLLPQIQKYYPQKIKKYCEPFVGGGAVLFDVLQRCQPEEILINDINAELINTYLQIKNNCEALIDELSELQQKYKASTMEENKNFFLENRKRFNELKSHSSTTENETENLEKAALFIFLNKTCFNGLYRVNKKGEFNVPFNNAKNPLLCDSENLKLCSKLLQNVQMTVGDYSFCRTFIDTQTFVYLDPPYRPLTQTAAFTSYSENNFGDKEQIELGKFVEEISEKGAKILLSNSDPKNTEPNDNFFDDLYSDFAIERISATRMINSNAKKRGAVSELLVMNIANIFSGGFYD
jgi:DNA adenine methylase